MNLYLVLALALGVSAPAVSARATSVVAESRVQRQRAVPFAVRRSPFAVKKSFGQRPTANSQRVDAPLTGSATPRAPAFSC